MLILTFQVNCASGHIPGGVSGSHRCEVGPYDGGTVYLTKEGILEGPACSCAEDGEPWCIGIVFSKKDLEVMA